MNKSLILLLALYILTSCSSTLNKNNQPPLWLSDSYRNNYFPKDKYYLVFNEKKIEYFSSKSKEEIKKEFRNELENQLVKQIQDKISIRTASTDLQTDNTKIDYISSVIRETSQSASAKLMDKKEESFIENKKISMMIYVKKSDLINGYYSILNENIGSLKNNINYYLSHDKEEGISPFGDLNTEFKTIQEDLDIYTILSASDPNSLEFGSITNAFNTLSSLFLQLNVKYGYDKMKIDSLINEADIMYQREAGFENIMDKLNDALLYDPTNIKVLDKKKDYNQKWVDKLSLSLNSKEINKEYSDAIIILDKLIAIDIKKETLYKEKQKNIIKLFFNETIDKINKLIKNNSITESTNLIDQISKYSYVNSNAFNKVKFELDKIIIENSVITIENYIYEKNYDQAAIDCKNNLISYPDNRELQNLLERIEDLIQAKKKQELKDSRSTRYVIELNYSASHIPEIVQNKNSLQPTKLDISKIDISKPLPYYQVGLYRKINIKEKQNELNSKHKFSYSQIGLKAGYLDLSTYNFQNNTTSSLGGTFVYTPSRLIQLEVSYIWRRFFQFNIGAVNETLPEIKSDFSKVSKQTNYLCSTIGFRIPFNFIHLTADVTGLSDGKDVIKLYAKAGISINIGLSKRYNGEDKKYIKNEVKKLKN